jgi:hypothetical protein
MAHPMMIFGLFVVMAASSPPAFAGDTNQGGPQRVGGTEMKSPPHAPTGIGQSPQPLNKSDEAAAAARARKRHDAAKGGAASSVR